MKKEKKEPTHSTFSTIIWTLSKQWKHTRACVILLIVMIPIYVAEQYLYLLLPKTVVAEVLAASSFEQIMIKVSILVGGLFLISATSASFGIMKMAYNNDLTSHGMYELSMKMMEIDYMTLESANFQDMQNRAHQPLWSNGQNSPLSSITIDASLLVRNIIGYFLFGTMISFVNPWIAVILTITPVVNYYFMRKYNNFEYANRDKWTPLDRKINYIVSKGRTFETAKDIRIYGLNTWFVDAYKTLAKERLSWNVKLLKKSFSVNLADLIIIFLRDGLAYYILISMTLNGEITPANFIFYFGAIGGFATWVGGIIQNFNSIHSLNLQICDLRDVLDWKDNTNRGKGIDISNLSNNYSIDIENLSFKYDSAQENTLTNINLHIKQGEKIAIVGINGAGKTTLIKTICGLYSPIIGEVKIARHDKKEYNIDDYFSLFSVVFQDFNMLCTSIGEVISSSTFDKVDRTKVENCLKVSGLWDKISSLPDGIDTPLNRQLYPNGIDLSGGEKQKLMLAKAIYKDAPILILDEPTSALDPIAENEMYLRYNELTRDKTSIFISHRLSSTRFCDRILFLENGQIIEEGSHENLLQLGGKYAKMFEVQSHYYKEEVEVL